MRGCRGFTLLELVLVIIVMSVGFAGVSALYNQAAHSVLASEEIQVAAILAQEKAEQILADRRELDAGYGYDSITTARYPAETPIAGFAAYDRTVTVTDVSTNPPCTVAAVGTCKQVQVSVTKGAATLADVVFLIVDY